jgi:hypothetical protein
MRKLLLIALIFGAFACKDEPVMETPPVTEDTEILFTGTFESSAHPTSGPAEVQSDGSTKNLVFKNFKSDSGPDLRVYLSKDQTDDDFIDLGTLKGTEGSFFYELDSSVNLDEYSTVLIWCEDFSVLFGFNTLK